MKLFLSKTGCIENKDISSEMLLPEIHFKFLHLFLGKIVNANLSEICNYSLL